MNRKHLQSMYHTSVNLNLMDDNLIQINGGIMINVNVNVEKRHVCEKDYIWNPATCSCENAKYLASIIDDSVITCDKIIDEETKTVTTNFSEKNAICKTKIFYILLAF